MYNKLREFVLKGDTEQENIVRIHNYGCELLIQDYLIKHAPELSESIEKKNSKQKQINQIYEAEVISLSQIFSERGLLVLHLKGISLLNEIYPNDKLAYKKRKINDIDILISQDKLVESLDLLGELGYFVCSTNERVSSKIISSFHEEVVNRGIHFPQFYKFIDYRGKPFKIKMDCHVSIIHTLDHKKEKMGSIVEKYEIQYLNGYPIKVLELHYRLLHLILHFTKETFRGELRYFILGERQLEADYKIKLPLLYEIALLISLNTINWTLLVTKAIHFGCQDEVKLTMLLLERIYPDLVEYKIFRELKVDKNCDLTSEKYLGMFYCLEIQNIKNIDILESSISEKAQALISYYINNMEEMLDLNKTYFLSEYENKNLICKAELLTQNKNSNGEIFFSLNNNFFTVVLSGDQLLKTTEIYFVFGSNHKSDSLFAYINKISFKKSSVTEYMEGDCEVQNGYIYMKLKKNVKVNYKNSTISFKFPLSMLGITRDSDFLLFDIGIPSIYSNKLNKLRPYSLNDTGNTGVGNVFHLSPRLLNLINLKREG